MRCRCECAGAGVPVVSWLSGRGVMPCGAMTAARGMRRHGGNPGTRARCRRELAGSRGHGRTFRSSS